MAENPYVYMLVGAMGVVILRHWLPSLQNLSYDSRNITSLEQIPGIDIGTLAICRQKGLV